MALIYQRAGLRLVIPVWSPRDQVTLNLDLTGDSADIDINQLSGSCVSGSGNACATPNAHITLVIDSDNSIIQINQKDTANDS